MSKSKDPSSKLHEKHQTILADLLRDEDNKYCADCMAKGPRWASWNLGVFMCIRCAGIHRNLGVHVSRVKSVNLDSWTPEQIESIQRGGNKYAKEKYEANLPANFRRPQDDYAVEQFIRAKYERKLYIEKGKGGSNSSKGKELSVQEQKNKAKQKKTLSTSSTQKSAQIHVSVPRPSSARQSPSPQPLKHTLVTSSSSSSVSSSKATGADLLISLESQASKSARKTSPQPVVDLLTGLGTPTPSDVSTSTSSGGSKASDPFGSMQPTGPMSNQGLFSGQGQQVQVSTTPTVGISNNKDSIMSLYGAQNQQPQLSSYTAQGYPVNAFYYQQQQEAAMRMAHMAAVQQHQVNQVTAQMQKIKMNQQPAPSQPFPSMSNGGVPSATAAGMGMGIGGQTLNPTLW